MQKAAQCLDIFSVCVQLHTHSLLNLKQPNRIDSSKKAHRVDGVTSKQEENVALTS